MMMEMYSFTSTVFMANAHRLVAKFFSPNIPVVARHEHIRLFFCLDIELIATVWERRRGTVVCTSPSLIELIVLEVVKAGCGEDLVRDGRCQAVISVETEAPPR